MGILSQRGIGVGSRDYTDPGSTRADLKWQKVEQAGNFIAPILKDGSDFSTALKSYERLGQCLIVKFFGLGDTCVS
jgi:hypothetical protein